MEYREQPSFRFLDEALHARLETEPFEFARNQFVAGHHGLDVVFPVGADQWTAARFLGFESTSASTEEIQWTLV